MPLTRKAIKTELAVINNITEHEVQQIEDELDVYEKVSLVFLLYGSKAPSTGLQKLLVLSAAPDRPTTLVAEWTRSRTAEGLAWRGHLIEALCIIQANAVLVKLGLDLAEQKARFLPHNNNVSVHVHPMLKSLFHVCENLTYQLDALVKAMQSECDEKFLGRHSTFLEIHLLHWLTNKRLALGSWEYEDTAMKHRTKCDVKLLSKNLLIMDLEQLHDVLSCTENMLNKNDNRQCNKITNIDNHQHNKITSIDNKPELNNCNKDGESSICSNISMNDAEMNVVSKKINNVTKSLQNIQTEDSATGVYKICTDDIKCAGICLIINQEEFYQESDPDLQHLLPNKPLENRVGTNLDCCRLRDLFYSYGYKVIIKKDLTHRDMLECITSLVDAYSKKLYSVVLCILSHGQKGAVFGSNSIPVPVDDIEAALMTPLLASIPKILIIQACQGTPTQQAIRVDHDLRIDGPNDNALQSSTSPEKCDLVTAWSTVPGFASVRDEKHGSWFIQTLCDTIERDSHRDHMLDILTTVIRFVSDKRWGNRCMVPMINSTFRKKLYLPQRKPKNNT